MIIRELGLLLDLQIMKTVIVHVLTVYGRTAYLLRRFSGYSLSLETFVIGIAVFIITTTGEDDWKINTLTEFRQHNLLSEQFDTRILHHFCLPMKLGGCCRRREVVTVVKEGSLVFGGK